MTLRRTVVRLSRALRQRFAFPGSSPEPPISSCASRQNRRSPNSPGAHYAPRAQTRGSLLPILAAMLGGGYGVGKQNFFQALPNITSDEVNTMVNCFSWARVVALIVVGMTPVHISASQACVVGLTLYGRVGPTGTVSAGLAASDAGSVTLYETIQGCNSASSFKAQHLSTSGATKGFWETFDSITFACKVPDSCRPTDAEVEPFFFIYFKSYYEKGLTYQDIIKMKGSPRRAE